MKTLPTASRRALLMGFAAAATPMAPALANALSEPAPGGADPVFAAIDHHVKTMEAWFDAMRRQGDTSAERKALDELSADLCGRETDASFAVVMAQPTTLAGVCALLHHVAQHQYLNMTVFETDEELYQDEYETVLSFWNLATDKEQARLAKEFPLRVAAALRNIIERGQA
jgi:hypothetical protein